LPMRTVLQLRYGEDLPIQDIAKILRVPRGTVASRINRAKQELKRRMKKEGY
jgi:RNA polymerase sigma-70 factor (ECF subfamily)